MIIYLAIFILLAIYSFTRQDLNLVLYNFSPWDGIHRWLEWLGWYARPLATLIFLILSLLLIIVYLFLIRRRLSWQWLVLFGLIGVLAYPMFSYDLFNYIFNAKMVLIYHVNPHIRTAIEFSPDPMLRFMQNVHTPAPYAYGWTILSLIPGLAWFSGKFTLAFWVMKAFVTAFWLAQLWILRKLVTKLFPSEAWRFWLFALNPFVIAETLINGHNDVVMMFLSLVSFWFLLGSKKVYSFIFLFLSASIKYASIVLLPFYFIDRRLFTNAASVLLLAVMFTRPDQLHSWYLIWAFSFAVLAKSKWLLSLVTALTIGALLRYAPYIYYGNWDQPVYLIRNLIWLGSLILSPVIYRVIKNR
jgi:hypothetical protein